MAKQIVSILLLFSLIIWWGFKFTSEEDKLIFNQSSKIVENIFQDKSVPLVLNRHKEISNWSDIKSALQNIDNMDQGELDLLYDHARKMIDENPKKVFGLIQKEMPKMVHGKITDAFFSLGSWVRYSQDPYAVLDVINGVHIQKEIQTNSHHTDSTPHGKLQRLKSYTLRELGKRIDIDGSLLSNSKREVLAAKLQDMTNTEKSLDVSLEIFQVLKVLDEKEAIIAGLKNYSPRDRDLISDTLDLEI